MIYVRSVLFLVFLGVSVFVIWVPIALLRRFAPYPILGGLANRWGLWNLWALRKICHLDMRIHGMENLPAGPVIVLSKHQSAWETLALRGILPSTQVWVLKRELMWIPIFGWALAAFNPIAIDRKAGRKSVKMLLEQGKHWLDAGRMIVIFPEGTRVAPGERKPYNVGGALLAERTGRSIVPIAHNAGVFWRRRSIAKHPGVIDLVIGPPIIPAGRKAQEINKEVEDWIEGTVARLPGARA